MLEWYKDDNLIIKFTEEPIIRERYPLPSMSQEEKREIELKPYICLHKLGVELIDLKKSKNYKFDVEKGYTWDGASVSRIFWRIIGANTDPRFMVGSMIHDILCENHNLVDGDRYFADKVFERLLYVAGVGNLKRWAMFHAVDNFQKFQNWEGC